MKIAILCDLHYSGAERSAQAFFLSKAIAQMKTDRIHTVITLGDVSAYGEETALHHFQNQLSEFDHHILLGNSDVRDPTTTSLWLSCAKPCKLSFENRTFLGIHSPYPKLSEEDRAQISALRDGDILAMHHTIDALEPESKKFLLNFVQYRKLTVFTAHHHRFIDQIIGKSRVIIFPALDPDKAIGQFPSITYVNITEDTIHLEQKQLSLPSSIMHDIQKMFGISCVNNKADITYALENNLYAAELRCNGSGWSPEIDLLPLLEKWRNKTNGYLSVHMPNLRWKDNKINGLEQWYQAAEFAKTIGVNGLTVHPPYVSRYDMQKDSEIWNQFLKIYVDTFSAFPAKVAIGIENLHLPPDKPEDENSKFGCTPNEINTWIDCINKKLNSTDRVGHTLDVGHARNNGGIAQRFPISRWYELMGNRIRAYHIHQVTREGSQMQNHQPIKDWFGPMISYASFFYCWEKGIIQHKPIFLEVQGHEHYHTSLEAFQQQFP